jgi:hypothetical protein
MSSSLSKAVAIDSFALLLWCTQQTPAQQARTGDHCGGRPSDTGVGGTQFSPMGDFAGTVPLPLPPERTGLPLRLKIIYNAHAFGAVGAGWEIPLSYIKAGQTLAHG